MPLHLRWWLLFVEIESDRVVQRADALTMSSLQTIESFNVCLWRCMERTSLGSLAPPKTPFGPPQTTFGAIQSISPDPPLVLDTLYRTFWIPGGWGFFSHGPQGQISKLWARFSGPAFVCGVCALY